MTRSPSPTSIDPSHCDLLDPAPHRRLAALDRVDHQPTSRYALRAVVLGDPDGRVRATAALLLGRSGTPSFTETLVEAATLDDKPLVREAAWRALARRRGQDASVSLAAAHASTSDPIWWVRVAATVALARMGGSVAALRAVFDDPFWRVRHAAIQALVILGNDSAEVRAEVFARTSASEVEAAAVEYLRRRWQGDDSGGLDPAAGLPPSDPLWDPDPAVTTARLEAADAAPSLGLVIELLADPHQPLREVAAGHLARRSDTRALRAALHWLDEPRIPHAAETVTALINRLGDRAAALAGDVLEDPTGPGGLAWAVQWIGATRSAGHAEAARALLAHSAAAVREAAIGALWRLGLTSSVAEPLIDLAADPVEPVQHAAVQALVRSARPAAATLLCRAPTDFAPRARRVLTRFAIGDESPARVRDSRLAADAGPIRWAERAATDPDGVTRALALRALGDADRLAPALRAAAQADPDPWIRTAVLGVDTAVGALATDPDPGVRRAALVRLRRHRGALPAAGQALREAARSPDPRLRAGVAGLLDPAQPLELEALLRLTFDHHPMVRGSAADRLEETRADQAIRTWLGRAGDDSLVARAGYTFLSRRLDPAAAAEVAAAQADRSLPDAVKSHLAAIALTFGDAAEGAKLKAPVATSTRAEARGTATTTPPATTERARRQLGNTGLWVAPLALSGANDLVTGGFERALEAGVDLYFWEPRYLTLGRFLRRRSVRQRVHVVAGTYHASPAAIEADVDTALRRLRRDRIDLFLLYWTRSAERLSPDLFACLQRLKQAGKIGAAGFSTHHRDLARDAIAAQPWDAVMLRHSAAHPAAEDDLFGEAAARGVGVLTFTALCYGRLLQPSPGHPAPTATDCYRYSLSQPGVTAVISAPARYRELIENLAVLDQPNLPPDAVAALRDHGRWIYAQSKDFNALVRRTPKQLPAAAERLVSLLDDLAARPRF